MNQSQNPVTSRFADYFVICGLDIRSGLELDRFSGDTLHCSPLDRPYKSKVLAHYPDNVPWNPFDHEAVAMLCLPHGLHFRTQKNSLEPRFHSFITTREDGRRTYGFSLVFYEEVTDRSICSAMQTLQAMHLTEVSSKRTTPPVASSSGRKSSKRSQQGLLEGSSHSTRSLPRHFKLSSHRGSIGSALEECFSSTNFCSQAYYDASQDSLYASKSIALVCQLPFVRAAQKFLMGLYKYAVDLANEENGTVSFNCNLYDGAGSESNGELSLESHVHNLLYEVQVPQPGRSMRFRCFGEPIVVQRPSSIEEPPLFDFPLRELFPLLGGPKRLLELFTCLLLENQVLLYSSDYQRLMLVAESITCLLFPFAWQHVYVPILPSSLIHFLEAPVPFVMGLPAGQQSEKVSGSPAVCLSCRSNRTKLASVANLCFVDIDNHTIQLPEDVPLFPQQKEFIEEIYELLKQYGVPSGDKPAKGTVESGPTSKSCPSCSHQSKHGSRKHSRHSKRKQSWSHDSDSASSSSSPSHTARYANSEEVGKRRGSARRAAAVAAAAAAVCANSGLHDGLQGSSSYSPISPVETSEALKRVLAIAANARVNVSDLNVVLPATSLDSNRGIEKVRSEQEQYIEDLKFNNALREVFLNRFVHIFSAYEHFIIMPDQDMEQWLSSRDSMQNFDKATFLSDQPVPHLPFLSRFIESQMFATLIDNKILATWQDIDPNLRVFDKRINLLRKRFGDSLVRTPSYEPCTAIKDAQLLLETRLATVEFTAPPPRALPPTAITTRARERARRKRLTNLAVHEGPKMSSESSADPSSSHSSGQTSGSVFQSDNCTEVSSRKVLEERLESTLEKLQGQLERTKILEGFKEDDAESGNNKVVLRHYSSQESRIDKKHPPFPLLDHDALNREPARPPRKRTIIPGESSSSGHHSQRDRMAGDDEALQSRLSSKCELDGEKDSAVFGSRDIGKSYLISERDPLKMEIGRSRINSATGESLLKSLRQPKISGEPSPAEIAQTNWNFVEALLKDVKTRTKRMLVEKMGSEAVELGHGTAASLSGLEENTLMASLCDLLERIWSHGLQNKQGKSALWSHLLNFQELEDCSDSAKLLDPNTLAPALAWCVLRKRLDSIPTPPKLGFTDMIFSIKSKNILELATYISNFDLSSVTLETDLNLPRNGKFSTLPNCSRRSASTDRNPKGISNASPITQPAKTSGDDQPVLPPLPVSVTFDMRNVQGMSEIKTDIGYARAWVRLSLEKKLLSAHLRTLLSDQALLRTLYRRCAFLRCDDEKEQFLYHLLTLNAVDYFCFTNTYTTTRIPYRVVIFPMRKGGATTTSANAWVAAAGTLGGTNPVKIPKGHLEFVFHHKNLGILTTLRIGHDNTGPSPKWMVEHVIVRNEITGHSYKFPCGRWLGRGVDDDSTERLLVGEMIAWQSPDGTGGGTMGFGGGGGRARGSGSRMGSREDLLDADKGRSDVDQKRTPQHQRRGSIGSSEMTRCSTPPPPNPPPLVMSLFPSPTQFLQYSPPSLSPSTASSNRRRTPTVPEIQQMLGDAVNSIVKYYHRQKQEKEGLTMLLCGEMGLVHCLAQVFLYGFKSTRLFGKNLYLWDYFVKVKEEFLANRRDGEKREGRRSESKTREKSTVRQYCRLIEQICNSSRTLGKDGKFQLFICLGVREHLLHRMIGPLSSSRTTLEMFEEYSFLRNPSHSTFLSHILKSLDDFEFNLESSLTRGMMDTL